MALRKDQLALQGWDAVDETMGQLAQMRAERGRRTAVGTAQIAEIQAVLDNATADLDFKIRQAEQNIRIYAMAHLDDIRNGERKTKSLTLTNGKVLTREEQKLVYPDNEQLIALIKGLDLEEDMIRNEEKPLKGVIAARLKGDADLADRLGIEVTRETSVSIELF